MLVKCFFLLSYHVDRIEIGDIKMLRYPPFILLYFKTEQSTLYVGFLFVMYRRYGTVHSLRMYTSCSHMLRTVWCTVPVRVAMPYSTVCTSSANAVQALLIECKQYKYSTRSQYKQYKYNASSTNTIQEVQIQYKHFWLSASSTNVYTSSTNTVQAVLIQYTQYKYSTRSTNTVQAIRIQNTQYKKRQKYWAV